MKGICFKEPLFHATIEGRKTQTRRLVPRNLHLTANFVDIYENGVLKYIVEKSRYKINEIVYLKEPYDIGCMDSYIYKYGHAHEKELSKLYGWRNKLFMPAEAARYFIKITGVRAERLQDISVEDCIKEGITFDCAYEKGLKCHAEHALYYRECYAELIDEINGKGTWMSDPFVWVYDYELIK